MPTVEERIRKVLVKETAIDAEEIVPDARFVEDLDLDSLDGVEVVMAIEEEFGIEIPDEEVMDGNSVKLQTVGDLIRCVESKLPGGVL